MDAEIKNEFVVVRVDIRELRADVQELRADVQELRTDVQELRTDVQELRAGMQGLDVEIRRVDTTLRQEIREEGVATRRHFDVVAESLRDDIRIIAEGLIALDAKVETIR